MVKTKWKKISLALMSLLFALAMTFALIEIIPAKAEESVTITIHADANGKVEYAVTDSAEPAEGGYTEVAAEAVSVEISIKQDQYLHLKATAADTENYLFQCWTTTQLTDSSDSINSAVSMRAEDTFTYQELADQSITELYSNFTAVIEDSAKRAAAKLKIEYNSQLGDVYFFAGKRDVTETDMRNHGLWVDPEGVDMPFRAYMGRKEMQYYIDYVSFFADPKTGLTSSIDPTQKVDAVFGGWSGTHYEYQNDTATTSGELNKYENESFKFCNSSNTTFEVEPLWKNGSNSNSSSGFSYLAASSFGAHGVLPLRHSDSGINDPKWVYNKGKHSVLFIDPTALHVTFSEKAPTTKVEITPSENGESKETVTMQGNEQTVELPYGQKNALTVKLGKFAEAAKQDYKISVSKQQRNLTTGEITVDDSTKCEVIGNDYAFNIPDINVNMDIVITPDYGDGYFVEPIVIHVKLTTKNGLKDLVSEDSADMTVDDSTESQKNQWYLDPQFGLDGGVAYTSGLSYPEIPNDKFPPAAVAQLHFQVTGSGVFMFQFYLDGWMWGSESNWWDSYYSLALYSTNLITVANRQSATILAGGATKMPMAGSNTHVDCIPGSGTSSVSIRRDGAGWCTASITISGDDSSATHDIYIAHFTNAKSISGVSTVRNFTVMSVRNVAFYQGNNNVSWGIYKNDDSGSKDGYGTVTATKDEQPQEAPLLSVTPGTKIDFKVDYNDQEYKFYGWSDGTDLLSEEKEFTYTVHGGNGDEAGNVNIYAVLAPNDEPFAFRHGGKFYAESQLQDALDGAKASPNAEVYVLKNVTVEGEITIHANVNLILPYDADGHYSGNGRDDPDHVSSTPSWKATGKDWSKPYLTFTLKGTMTINGTFDIGAVNHCLSQLYCGLTSGAYSQFVNDGTVTVGEGGYLDVYGLVTGTGKINVLNGGKLAEPFLILDYAGGSNTSALYQSRQTPFNRYAMINIQCQQGITVNYGGEFLGHASLYALGNIFTASAPVISYATAEDDENARGLIMLTEGGSVDIVYTEEDGIDSTSNCTKWIGRTKLTFKGGAMAKFMSLNVGFTISTKDVTAFSVPYNYEIVLESGKYTVDGNFKLMPGSSLTVGEGATLDLNASLYVYDWLVQHAMSGKSYPSSEKLTQAGYSVNANFTVNGTFNINDGATFMGVVQTTNTNGTAKIHVGEDVTLKSDDSNVYSGVQDGAMGGYDCNWAVLGKYSARIWDKVNKEIITLEAGNEYTSTWLAEDETWSFTGCEITWCNGHTNSEPNLHADVKGDSPTIEGMKGSWMKKHEEHDLLETGDGTVDLLSNGYALIPFKCTVEGCDHKEDHLTLLPYKLDMGDQGAEKKNILPDQMYRGTAYTADEVKAWVKAAYQTAFAEAGLEFDCDVSSEALLGVKDYEISITLKNAYFHDVIDWDEYVGEKYPRTFKLGFTITPYDVSALGEGDYTVSGLEGLTYNGDAQTPLFTVSVTKGDLGELTFDGDSLVWANNTDATNGQKATVTLTANGNFTGSLTLSFDIAKKAVNLSLNKQTADYSGTMPAVSSDKAWYETSDILEKDLKNVTIKIDFAEKGETWNVGSYDLTATLEADNYVLGEVSNTANAFEITAKSLTGAEIGLEEGPFVYNGKQFTPFQSLTLDGFVFTAEDYDVTYSHNTDATTDEQKAVVTVTGKGNFKDSVTKEFVIAKRTIAGEGVTVSVQGGPFTYNGEAQTPNVTITIEDVAGDVTVSLTYDNNKNAGQATIHVAGTGNFEGTRDEHFEIAKAQITITPEPANSPEGQPVLSGDQLKYTVAGTLYEDGNNIKEGLLLTVSDYNEEEAVADKTFKITVSWKTDGYTAAEANKNYDVNFAEGTYTITAAVFEGVTFGNKTETYNGNEHTMSVTYPEEPKAKGTFSAVYTYTAQEGSSLTGEKAVNAGKYDVKAVITFTAEADQRAYTLELTAVLTIDPRDISDAEITLEAGEHIYTGQNIEPKVASVTAGGLTVEAFETTYSDNQNAGKEAKVTVRATGGNFTGEADTTFEIKPKSISEGVLTAEDVVYHGGKHETGVTFELAGFTVTEGDYDLSYSNNEHVGTATVTLTAHGNFEGTMSEEYAITAKQIVVTVLAQSVTYTGKEPVLAQGAGHWTTTADAVYGSDDLQITLHAVGKEDGKWGAGKYEIDGVSANNDYAVTFTKGELTVAKKAVTVNISDAKSVYGEAYEARGWTVGEDALGEGDSREDLGITLTFAGDGDVRLGAGTYKISATATGANYEVTFTGSWAVQSGEAAGGTYTVEKRAVTVTIENQESVYDGKEPVLSGSAWHAEEGDIVGEDDLGIVLTKQPGADANTYPIGGAFDNDNYTVTFKEGVYTVKAIALTVEIGDQSAVYDYEHGYSFRSADWKITAGELAEGESKEDLAIVLSHEELTDAGTYAITGVCGNSNYAVTFTGSFSEGDLAGMAGTYTVEKLDVSDDAMFWLFVGDDGNTSEGDTIRVKFANAALALVGNAQIFEGETPKELKVSVDPASITEIAEYTVTVTITEKNYSGHAVFTVIVTDAEGYTQKLRETLDRLAVLAEGLDAAAFKEEDFAVLKEIGGLLEGLDEEEREVASEKLETYEALVAAWNGLADIDGIVETAETVANAPIEALFGAAATLSALAALAYIAMKGGIL